MKRPRFEDLLIVVFFTSAICFSHIHQGSLSIDGIRYADISAKILERGDWLHLYDEFLEAPYANKPPVLFWLTAYSLKVLGHNTFAAKFPAVCFVFFALVALYFTARKLYDEKTGYLAVLLLAANVLFFRSVIDLSFEGFVLLGACACFYVTTKLFRGEILNTRKSLLFGLGLFCFFISKPPYILVVLVPLSLILLRRKILFSTACSLPLWCGLLPFFIIGISWYLTRETSYLGRAIENQIFRPFAGGDAFFVNFLHWLKTIFIYYAPLSLISVWALIRAWRTKNDERYLIFYWLLPVIPIVLFVNCRGPYLLLSILAFAIFTAHELASYFSLKYLKFFFVTSGALVYALILIFNVQVHGFHYLVLPFKVAPHLLQQDLILCHDGGHRRASYPSRKRSEMILNFEFQKTFRVYDSHTIPRDKLEVGAQILAEQNCGTNLKESNLKFETITRFRRAELLKVIERPNEINMGPFEMEKSPKEDSSIH